MVRDDWCETTKRCFSDAETGVAIMKQNMERGDADRFRTDPDFQRLVIGDLRDLLERGVWAVRSAHTDSMGNPSKECMCWSRLKDLHPDVEWEELAGFRNRKTHTPYGVITELVWIIVESDLPALYDALDTEGL